MPAPIWTPPAERVAAANITAFQRMVAEQLAPGVTGFPSLYQWSIEKPDQFWQAVWDFCGVISSRPANTVLEGANQMPGARWFGEARLNFAENLLRFRGDDEAIVFWNESGRVRSLSLRPGPSNR